VLLNIDSTVFSIIHTEKGKVFQIFFLIIYQRVLGSMMSHSWISDTIFCDWHLKVETVLSK